MKIVRTSIGQWRIWLAAVIGVLGIIGGARQQAWAAGAELSQPTPCAAQYAPLSATPLP